MLSGPGFAPLVLILLSTGISPVTAISAAPGVSVRIPVIAVVAFIPAVSLVIVPVVSISVVTIMVTAGGMFVMAFSFSVVPVVSLAFIAFSAFVAIAGMPLVSVIVVILE